MPKHELCLLDADYREGGNGTEIVLYCKDSKGRSVVVLDDSLKPYFYLKLPKIDKTIIEKIKSIRSFKVRGVEAEEKIIGTEKTKVLKIICGRPAEVAKVREIIHKWNKDYKTYEYSINFYKRYMIDKGLSGMGWMEVSGESVKENFLADEVVRAKSVKPLEKQNLPPLNILAFDIENVEKNGEQQVIMLSMYGKNFRKVLTYQKDSFKDFVETLRDEKELLERFVQCVNERDVDILVGFNSDMHDFSIIGDRAEKLKVKLALSRDKSQLKFSRRAAVSAARLKGRLHMDLFNHVKTILGPTLQTEVVSLDAVSAELLGDKKIEIEYEEMLEAWRKGKNLEKMAEYCLKDSELTFRLSELLLPQIYELSRIAGQIPFDVARMFYSQLVEWYMSKRSFETGRMIPNQPKWDDIQERTRRSPFMGAYVKEPIEGLHENIAVMDFKSLYPSIIATYNVSPETFKSGAKNKGYQVPEMKDYWFCKDHEGFVAKVIREIIEKRIGIKKKLKSAKQGSEEWKQLNSEQFAVKTIANATYGALAFAGAKWYCYECAQSAAAFGRYYIKKVIADAQKFGFVVIYSDTDSMFVKLETEKHPKEHVEKFLEKINKRLPGVMELDLQGFYKRGIFVAKGSASGTAKKRYALIDEKGKMMIRGFEKTRGDWCALARDTQEKVLHMILDKKDRRGAVKYVKDIIRRVRARKFGLREVTIYEQLAKPLSEYKVASPHIAVARKMIDRGRAVGEGMVMMYVITKGKGSVSERAEPAEDADVKDIDVDYYIERQIVPPSQRVLAAFGVKEEELMG